jgi:hypothetical protein
MASASTETAKIFICILHQLKTCRHLASTERILSLAGATDNPSRFQRGVRLSRTISVWVRSAAVALIRRVLARIVLAQQIKRTRSPTLRRARQARRASNPQGRSL